MTADNLLHAQSLAPDGEEVNPRETNPIVYMICIQNGLTQYDLRALLPPWESDSIFTKVRYLSDGETDQLPDRSGREQDCPDTSNGESSSLLDPDNSQIIIFPDSSIKVIIQYSAEIISSSGQIKPVILTFYFDDWSGYGARR